ncbi:tetratricopeptide repeat protein [Asaia sp. BMEF1]|uniref:tetratricopeptide repeat protein n=1 Tax=Asaia sp. BMEF1 TaxID=3155932 RepID=UPI003F67A3AF
MPMPAAVPALDERLQAELYLAQWHLDRGAVHEAYRLFVQAAQSRHPTALNMLGRAYEQGWGVVRDVVLARSLFEAAADGGEGWAFYNLADLYLLGDGVTRDKAQAYIYYVEAARRGVSKAFNMLGLLHEEGYGAVAASYDYACHYFEAGSACGDEAARTNLARMKQ